MVDTLSYAEFEKACVAQALRRAARHVTRRYEQGLRGVGLTMGQFTTLAALARPQPVAVTVLADQLGMDRTTLTRDLAPLERRGLIQSGHSKKDKRVRTISLTSEGRVLLGKAVPIWRAAQDESHDRLDADGWPALQEALAKLET